LIFLNGREAAMISTATKNGGTSIEYSKKERSRRQATNP
jgi:hypothetical protein